MYSLNCRGKLLNIGSPIVMGIINTTPDSFFSGSRQTSLPAILEQAEKMLKEGAAILDIGGQSTRPGSENIGVEEEMSRVVPAIETIHKNFPEAIISIDSFRATVVSEAINAGAVIINDISGGNFDEAMIPLAAGLQVPYVLSFSASAFSEMHHRPDYNDVVLQTFDQLSFRIAELRNLGLNDVIIDPGFGFAKSASDNFEVLRHLNFFTKLNCPILAGLSRKATVYKTLNVSPEEALNGSTVMHTIALLNGASILRVHDVKEAREACRLIEAYQNK